MGYVIMMKVQIINFWKFKMTYDLREEKQLTKPLEILIQE